MNRKEITEFKKFLEARKLYGMFALNYRQYRLTNNPSNMEDYLERAKAESVIPMAFIYPKSLYGKDFWLSLQEEWIRNLRKQQSEFSEMEQLDSLDLEIIDIKPKNVYRGLPNNTCSLNLKANRLTLNLEQSKMVAKKLSTHLLLTRSRRTADVVLMFNRSRGVAVTFKPGTTSLQIRNQELADHLVELLELDPEKEYFQIGIELLEDTKDYLLFLMKKR